MGAKAWVRTDSLVLPAAGTLILSQRPVGEVGSKQTLQACVCPGEEPNIEQERWTVVRGLWAGRGDVVPHCRGVACCRDYLEGCTGQALGQADDRSELGSTRVKTGFQPEPWGGKEAEEGDTQEKQRLP